MNERVDEMEQRIIAYVEAHYGLDASPTVFTDSTLRDLARNLQLERITALAHFYENNRRLSELAGGITRRRIRKSRRST